MNKFAKVSVVVIALLAVFLGTAAYAALPAVPYGTSGSAGAFPKPVHDWIHQYIIKPHVTEMNYTPLPNNFNLLPPFDTPTFAPTALDGRTRPPLFAGVSGQFVMTNEEMVAFIEKLPKNYLRWDYVMNYNSYDSGTDAPAVRNFGYPLVVLSKGPNGPVFHPEDVKALGKPIYYVQPANHANEWCGADAALSIIARLAYGDIKVNGVNVLDKITVVLMPRYNVDGAYWNIRGSNSVRGISGPDTNRDGTMMVAHNSRIASTILNAYEPHFGYDCHQMGWTTGVPGGTTRYYVSGDYGVGPTVNAGSVTVANNTQDGSGTTTLNRHFLYGFWAPIDLPNKFHNTPQVLSDWQDKSLEYMESYLGGEKNMHLFPYTLWGGNTFIRDWKGIETANGLIPGDRPGYLRGADCIPDEGYGDGFLGLKQMIAWCTEAPASGNGSNIGSDGYTTKMFFNFIAMETQMQFLFKNAEQIYKDVARARESFKTDASDIALWNHQTIDGEAVIKRDDGSTYKYQPRRQRLLKPDYLGQLADPATGNHFYEYEVPFWLGNRERKAGRTVTRPHAYIIDPNHMADTRAINDELAVFRLAYSGVPIYRLTEAVTVEVEGSTVRTIQNITVGNSNPVFSKDVKPTDWNANGVFTGDKSVYEFAEGNIKDTYLGGPDTAGSFGIQSQRISHADTAVETKTFPAGSYVVPIQGPDTNWGSLHATFMLEVLGKRNLGNSYWRLRPGTGPAANLQWPNQLWENYFPVAVDAKYPAYRYMKAFNTLKTELVYAVQPFLKGSNYAAGYPVSLAILKEKGFNIGDIKNIGLGYHFIVEGTFDATKAEVALTNYGDFKPATQFDVMIPGSYEGTLLKKWYAYDWDKKDFLEVAPYKSPTSGANFVRISGSFIGAEHEVVLIATASIDEPGKLPFPNLSALLNSDVTAWAIQNHRNGRVTIRITDNALVNGEEVTIFFVKSENEYVVYTKKVSQIRPGVFEAVFANDELYKLNDGTKYAIQYINSDETAKGYSTFNYGAFIYTEETGCNAGFGYAAVLLLTIFMLFGKRSK